MAKPSKHKQPTSERSDTPGFRKRSGIDPKGIAEPCICDPFGIRLFCFAPLSGGVAALNSRLRSSDAFGIASKMSKLQERVFQPAASNTWRTGMSALLFRSAR